MPTEEQTEWPSFDGVLKDVLPADVAARLRPESAVAAEARRRASVDRAPAELTSGPLALEPGPAQDPDFRDLVASVRRTLDNQPETIDPEPATADDAGEPTEDAVFLPEPLAPLELDTSHVRKLLETPSDAEPSFDISALDPLEPVSDLPDLTEVSALSDLPAPPAPFESTEPFESAEPFESPAPFETAPLQDENGPAVFQITDLEAYDFVEPVEADLGSDLYAIDEKLEPIELGLQPPATVIEHIDIEHIDIEQIDIEHTDDSPVEDDVEAEGAEIVGLFDGLESHDSFDSIATAEAIESELFDLDLMVGETPAAPDDAEHVDNVVQLRDFSEFDAEPLDNEPSNNEDNEDTNNPHEDAIVSALDDTPSYPTDDEYATLSETGTSWSNSLDDFSLDLAVNDSDGESSASKPSFVDEPDVVEQAIKEAPMRPKATWRGVGQAEERVDPWADIRPVFEVKKAGGWWANRPKFFGGDERKLKKAERKEQLEQLEQALSDAVDISFDSKCPDCNREVSVDLDDPIGRRVHVSCDTCNSRWHTPYHIDSEAS